MLTGKARGPPPRRSGPDGGRDEDGPDVRLQAGGARPKVPPPAAEETPPPLFDQWLACLKFVVGWNDQKKYPEEDIKDALRQHLAGEGIETVSAVDRLCDTVVPLLVDLRRIDSAVVKNVRGQALRNFKTVHISILRIVTFEMVREHETKLARMERRLQRKKEGGKAKLSDIADGSPYLAADISTLAKVVQHFRFDRAFSESLQQLIKSIRLSMKKKAGMAAGTEDAGNDKDGPPAKKRRKEAAAGEEEGADTGDAAADVGPAAKISQADTEPLPLARRKRSQADV